MRCLVVFTVNDHDGYCHEREVLFVAMSVLAGYIAASEVVLVVEFSDLLFEVANEAYAYFFSLCFVDYRHEIIAADMADEIIEKFIWAAHGLT